MTSLHALKHQVLAHAPSEGKHASLVVGLWLNRYHQPFLCQRVATRSVTFAVVVQGEKSVTFGDETLVYGPGDYLLVTGEQRYVATVANATADEPYLSLAIELSPDEVAAALLELTDAGEPAPSHDHAAVVSRLDPALAGAVVRLLATLDDAVERRVLAPLALREIMFRLLRSDSAAALRNVAQRRDGRIQRAVAFIQKHAHKRLTVTQIARQAAMSPSHFAHRFREVIRVTPMQFVRHVRLHRARMLLLDDGVAAAEVAGSVGYTSPSQFSRDFKAQFGAPPRTYAQRFRSERPTRRGSATEAT